MSVKVAFKIDGGMGSVILKTNFVKKFVSLLPRKKVDVTVFGHPSDEITHAIFDGLDFVDHIRVYTDLREEMYSEYDLVIQLETVPIILYKSKWLPIKSKKYYKITTQIEQFNRDNPQFIHKTAIFRPYLYQLAKMHNKNCVNAIDFGNFINLDKEFIYKICVPKNYREILSKWKLKEGEYVTLNRGSYTVAGKAEGTRVWPLAHYNRLVEFLKHVSPKLKIVQLGQTSDCPKITDCDLDLCGKTNLKELKCLLYGSVLHIDGEGGQVHLRKAMDAGPSAVLFGSTDPEYFGHETNINICVNICPCKCCEIHDLWHTKCLVSKEGGPLCLSACQPEYVFTKIETYLQNLGFSFNMYPKTKKLVQDKRFMLDHDWVMEWMRFQNITEWTVQKLALSELSYYKHTDKYRGHKVVPITEELNPAVAFLQGKQSSYDAYNLLKQISYQDYRHNASRYNHLSTKLSKTGGYDIKRGAIVVDQNNVILDGWHRASWLLNKYGKNYKISVVKIFK